MNTATAIDAGSIAQRYIAVWNETDATRRAQLLDEGWAEDARYVDPLMQASGHAQISALVGAVQQRYPGFRFGLAGHADAHGEHVRFSWTLGPSGAEDLIQGTDFVQLAAGKRSRSPAFWTRCRPAPDTPCAARRVHPVPADPGARQARRARAETERGAEGLLRRLRAALRGDRRLQRGHERSSRC